MMKVADAVCDLVLGPSLRQAEGVQRGRRGAGHLTRRRW
jgi:hypothetical protein